MARESKNETYFKEQVAANGGMTEKHVSPGKRGVPDQLVTWPSECGEFSLELVELKADGKEPNDEQGRDHRERARFGVHVIVLSSRAEIDLYIARRRQR